MTLSPAPLYTDIYPGPKTGQAYWTSAPDGVRLRIGCWCPEAARGTVLLLPGRTEYIEKYGCVTTGFFARGYATAIIDFRGQGLSDRLLPNVRVGHVRDFSEYQDDVRALVETARACELPEPFFLLAHSMGGCIGLRALHEGLPVVAAAFSGPMWGIKLSPTMRPVAHILSRLVPLLGMGAALPPGTSYESYVLSDPFEDNMLTTDPEMWDMMVAQLETHPELRLGGPSYTWLGAALRECTVLDHLPTPDLPTVTFQGSNERVVDTASITRIMERWTNGKLHIVPAGEHEVLLEGAAVRGPILDTICASYQNATS